MQDVIKLIIAKKNARKFIGNSNTKIIVFNDQNEMIFRLLFHDFTGFKFINLYISHNV